MALVWGRSRHDTYHVLVDDQGRAACGCRVTPLDTLVREDGTAPEPACSRCRRWGEQREEMLPCPFCGRADLSVGPQSALTYGVRCRQCRVTVDREVPQKTPRGLGRFHGEAYLRAVRIWTTRQAVRAWNTRDGRRPTAEQLLESETPRRGAGPK